MSHQTRNKAQPAVMVIFGASGDLTRRKLIPALFSLYCKNRLPEKFTVVGFAFDDLNDESFRQRLRAGVDEFGHEPFEEAEWQTFAEGLF
jgi:glucose-6-phosphate 1-dehydrogenase